LTPGNLKSKSCMKKSTIAVKPNKPYAGFPLFAHASKRWAKKIRGKTYYFGSWSDPDGALNKYLDQRDDLHAGRTPRPANGVVIVRDVLNHFLTAKKLLVESREIAARTWADYYATCERIGNAFGTARPVDDLRADDFTNYRAGIAKKWGPVAVGNEVQRVRSVFKYAYDAGLIAQPMRFGPCFKRPSKKTLRKARAEKGICMFEASDLTRILAAAKQPMRTMVLLGVNCGFGNADCATLPLNAIDLKTGWINYPRPKTGIPRRCKLWRETVKAIRDWLGRRPDAKNGADASLLFITKFGTGWDKSADGDNHANPISWELKKILKAMKLYRLGLGFYALRHTFATVAGESRDQIAVDHIMGHAHDDMASVYRERIGDDRLIAVSNHVHVWLFGTEKVK